MHKLAETIFALPAPGADADLYAADLVPVIPGLSTLYIFAALDGASAIRVTCYHKDNDAVVKSFLINAGAQLAGGIGGEWFLTIDSDYRYNVQLVTDRAVDKMIVGNIPYLLK